MGGIVRSASTRLGLGAEWERPGPDSAGVRTDLLVGGVLLVVSLVSYEVSRSAGMLAGAERGVPEQVAWTVASVLPLFVRRRYPLTAMALASAVFLGIGVRESVLSVQLSIQVFLFASLYNGVAWGRDRRLTAVVLGGILLVMTGWIVVIFAQASGMQDLVGGAAMEAEPGLLPRFPAVVLIYALINLVYFVGAAVFGQVAWHRALQTEQLAAQAHQLQAQRDEIARRAVVDERLRIARELHDVAAHHVSVIGVQAAAARRVLGVDGEAAGRALSAVEQSSREAVGEMRQLLGVLRSDTATDGGAADGRRPQPGLGSLEDLVQQAREQGLQVDLTVVGRPRDVPSTVSLSLYRTVQEALVNVRRHSTAQAATVTVRWSAPPQSWVEVEVLDAGRPRTHTVSGTGLGHRGMRERVELHHGEIEVGPRPLGGFRVRVRLPLAVQGDRSATRAAADAAR